MHFTDTALTNHLEMSRWISLRLRMFTYFNIISLVSGETLSICKMSTWHFSSCFFAVSNVCLRLTQGKWLGLSICWFIDPLLEAADWPERGIMFRLDSSTMKPLCSSSRKQTHSHLLASWWGSLTVVSWSSGWNVVREAHGAGGSSCDPQQRELPRCIFPLAVSLYEAFSCTLRWPWQVKNQESIITSLTTHVQHLGQNNAKKHIVFPEDAKKCRTRPGHTCWPTKRS